MIKFDGVSEAIADIMSGIELDDALTSFKKFGAEGDGLKKILLGCGFEIGEVERKLADVGSSGTKATSKLASGFAGLAAKLNLTVAQLGWITAGIAAFAAIAVGVNLYNQYIQECVENAKTATSAWSENNSVIDTQIGRIEELKTALDNGTLSEQEAYEAKSELYAIQQSLVDTYGNQASGIDLVNGELQKQIDLVRELSAAEADRTLNSNKTGIDEAIRQMTAEDTYNLGTVVNSNYANLRDDQREAAQALDEVLKEYENVLDVEYNTNAPTRTISFTGNVEDAEEVINAFMSDVREKARELGDSSLFEGLLNTSSSTLNDVNEVLANYQGLYEQAMQANLVSDRTKYAFGDVDQTAVEWMNDYTDAVEKYNEALASGDSDAIADAAAEFNNVDTAIQSLLEGGAFDGYEAVFADILEQLNEAAIANREFREALTDNKDIEALKKSGLSDIDFLAMLDTAGIQPYEAAFRNLINLAGEYGIEVDELVSILVELGIISGQATDTAADGLSNIKDAAIKATSATETLLSGISSAQELLNSQSTGISISVADFETAALNGYSNALEYNNGALQLNAEKVNELIKSKAKEQIAYNDAQKAIAQSEYLENAAQIEQLRNQLEALGDDEKNLRTEIETNIKSLLSENSTISDTCTKYDLMSASLREATSAYQHWINAQNSAQSGDMFDSSMSALDLIDKALNDSTSQYYQRLNNADYKAAVDLIIPESVDSTDQAAVNAYMDQLGELLTVDGSGKMTVNFAAFIQKAVDAGLMVLNEAGTDYEVAAGKTMEDFAKGLLGGDLELTMSMIQAMFGEMNEFGDYFDWSDEANKTFGDLAVSATEAAEALMAIEGNEDLKINLDVTDIEGKEQQITALRDTITQMEEYKGTKLDIDPSEVEYANEIIKYCIAQKNLLEYQTVLAVDTSQVTGELGQAIELLQQYASLQGQLEEAQQLGLDTTSIDADIAEVAGKIQSIDAEVLADLGVKPESLDSLSTSIQALTPNILIDAEVNPEAINGYTPDDKASEVVYGVDSTEPDSYEPDDKTAYVTYYKITTDVDNYNPSNLTRYVTYVATGDVSVNGTAHASGTARAGGDWGTAPGGPTLVGELGREIVVDPHTGKWYTVGDIGAEFVNIPRGAIIFNHEQSDALLEKGYVAGRGHASVSGTAMVTGSLPVNGLWPGSGSNSSNYGGSGNYHSSQNNQSSEDIAEDAKNAFEEAYAYHQHLLAMEQEDLEHYLRWLEAAYQDAYRNGQIELEDYYKYEEEVYDGRKELFEDYLNDLEHKIEGLERAGGNNGQIINLYLGMIKDIKNEIAQARARGLDENDEYIQGLIDQQRDYEDEIADIREEATDDAMGAVEDLVEYRIKMLKQDLENERDALEDKKDALKDFYDKQKEMLQDVYDEEKTLEERNEKRQAKTDIEAELAQLEFDDSAWAQKRKLELQEELAAVQKDLDDFEKEQTLESTQDLLDKMYERQEAQIQTEIDAIEAKLNDPNALYNQALHDIQNNTQALYMEMVEYNNKYGTGNPEDVKNMWDEAKASLDEFLATFGQAYKDIILVASPDGYASGTRSATPGIKKVDEESAEWLFTSGDGTRYRVFSGGEKVLNADATNFLYDFATSGGQILSNMFSNLLNAFNFNNIGRSSQPIQLSTGDIIIQGNADQRTVSEIRRAQRENIDFVLKEFTRLNK